VIRPATLARPRGRHRKPWDVGDGLVAATFGERGELLSLHRPHPVHGWIHLSGFLPFPEASRYNPESVRAYRQQLSDPSGEGLKVELEGLQFRDRVWLDGIVPAVIWSGSDVEAWWVPVVWNGLLRLWLYVRALGPGAPDRIRATFQVNLRLHRAAYAQITEGSPLPPTDPWNELDWRSGAVTWRAKGIEASARLYPVPPIPSQGGPGPIRFAWTETLELAGQGADRVLTLELAAGDLPEGRVAPDPWTVQEHLTEALRAFRPEEPLLADGEADGFVRRNLAFVLGCCAVDVGDATCLVTDPVLLPLSWNRDAYYCTCLLGVVGRRDRGPVGQRAARVIRRHLTWLFEVAHRSDGLWGRSHLTGGAIKDPVFQLDQQWYPILELVRASLDWGLGDLWRVHRAAVLEVLEALRARRSPSGLWPTSETPADDPLSLPYHFSSHVLAWRTLRLLAQVERDVRLEEDAEAVRRSVLEHFRIQKPRVYAYATDGQRHLLYHDANDLPTACAPRWGFCSADDPWWRSTVRFAWSPQNPAYFRGRYPGLGSLHAAAPWTLGEVQRWIVGHVLGRPQTLRAACRRLLRVAFDDRLLCESYDPGTGVPKTRAWFAWPGAAMSALLLGDPL